ncbi:MAG TPA: prevent-host-death protein [Terriglobia bacterium]|nr:prevent-host-death protein [Terriglobia bacterium]
MIDLNVAADIEPLTGFKRNTVKFAKRLKRSRRPMVLTVEGKARFVVFDAKAFDDWKDRFETVLEVKEALAEEREGRPATEIFSEIRRKRFGLSRRTRATR